MTRTIVAFAAFAVALGYGVGAHAQSTQTTRGDIAAVDNATLHLKSSSGQETTIKLPDDVRVSLRVPAKLDDIKSGTFVGTAATPGPNGTLVASEVHIFPEALRGTGEGHRPMSTMPGSTMTNATVAGVSPAAAKRGTMTNATVGNVGAIAGGRTLKLAYKGGEQTVFVSDKTPVVLIEAGSRGSLTPGAHVIVYAQRDTSGDRVAEIIQERIRIEFPVARDRGSRAPKVSIQAEDRRLCYVEAAWRADRNCAQPHPDTMLPTRSLFHGR